MGTVDRWNVCRVGPTKICSWEEYISVLSAKPYGSTDEIGKSGVGQVL
ncbi:hypothetical protein ACVWVY_003736 [Bradyrhizobium sp. URHC0002]